MVLANIKWPNIVKYGIFWYHFVDFRSLIQNLYKYTIFAQVNSHKIDFKQILPCKKRKNQKHYNL